MKVPSPHLSLYSVLTRCAATSAVDLDTDRAIQEIIRGPLFDDVTILTIAYVTSLVFLS